MMSAGRPRSLKSVHSGGIFIAAFALGILLAWLVWPPRVVVRWETASEVDTAGFFLYRADSPDGPFLPLSDAPIPARGDPLTGAAYRFEDREVAWGRVYYYQLEELERTGARNRYPDVVEGRAGIGPAGALATGLLMAILTYAGGALYLWRRKNPPGDVKPEA